MSDDLSFHAKALSFMIDISLPAIGIIAWNKTGNLMQGVLWAAIAFVIDVVIVYAHMKDEDVAKAIADKKALNKIVEDVGWIIGLGRAVMLFFEGQFL